MPPDEQEWLSEVGPPGSHPIPGIMYEEETDQPGASTPLVKLPPKSLGGLVRFAKGEEGPKGQKFGMNGYKFPYAPLSENERLKQYAKLTMNEHTSEPGSANDSSDVSNDGQVLQDGWDNGVLEGGTATGVVPSGRGHDIPAIYLTPKDLMGIKRTAQNHTYYRVDWLFQFMTILCRKEDGAWKLVRREFWWVRFWIEYTTDENGTLSSTHGGDRGLGEAPREAREAAGAGASINNPAVMKKYTC